MESTDYIIQTKSLSKTFLSRGKGGKSEIKAVQEISFGVKRGEIFGLLGPNGAGKTTTMRMLSTLLAPTGGTAKLSGFSLLFDQSQIRSRIGYVSQVGGMQPETSGRENIVFQGRLYGQTFDEAEARTDELLKLLKLQDFALRKTATYSGGQRRIFDLACGIVHKPEILFLDEPSTGLDPQNRAHVWEQVKALRDSGTTIFVTTHYLEEADALCDRVAIVDGGKVVAIGSPDELKQKVAGDHIRLGFGNTATARDAASLLSTVSGIRGIDEMDTTIHVHVNRGEEELPRIMKILHEENLGAMTIELSRPTLDDVFLKLTGRTLRDSEAK
jgi:ABC-2 type transport system ATP-binding protein